MNDPQGPNRQIESKPSREFSRDLDPSKSGFEMVFWIVFVITCLRFADHFTQSFTAFQSDYTISRFDQIFAVLSSYVLIRHFLRLAWTERLLTALLLVLYSLPISCLSIAHSLGLTNFPQSP